MSDEDKNNGAKEDDRVRGEFNSKNADETKDGTKKPESASEEMDALRDWDRGNTNVSKMGYGDQPTVVLDHPEFEPDMTMVGKQNPFGNPSDEQKRAMGWAVDGFQATVGENPDENADGSPHRFGPTMGAMLPAGTGNTGGNAGQIPALRQHGFSAPGHHIGAGLNYYTVYTTIDITPTGVGQLIIPRGNPPGVYTDTVSNSQLMLDKLVETISLRAQPVVMSQVSSMAYSAYNATPTPTFAPTSGTVWSMSFTIEHNGAWDTKQVGWTNSTNPLGNARPAIMGGPTPYNTNPDLTDTLNSNLNYMSPAWVNTGSSSDAATNTFVVVSSGPF
jgi:hypothetical protein